jgi:hypothetical protein
MAQNYENTTKESRLQPIQIGFFHLFMYFFTKKLVLYIKIPYFCDRNYDFNTFINN